jgi:outer membrane protein assembly factor BamB
MAFRKESGVVAWATGTDTPGYSSPLAVTIHGIRQVLFFTVSGLTSIAPGDGALLWQVPWQTPHDVNAAMPVFLPPDRVFISSSYDVGGAVYEVAKVNDGFDVSEVWRSRVMKNHFNSSVLHDGHLYGFDNGTLKCVDSRTGDEKWRQRGFARGSLIVADGHLIILGEGGRLALAEATPEAFRQKGSAQPLEGRTWTMPTLSRGRLFLRDRTEMVALDLRRQDGGRKQ